MEYPMKTSLLYKGGTYLWLPCCMADIVSTCKFKKEGKGLDCLAYTQERGEFLGHYCLLFSKAGAWIL